MQNKPSTQPKLILKTAKTISFDAGGTLLYPFPSVEHIYASVMSRHGLDLDPADIKAGFSRAWQAAEKEKNHQTCEASEKAFWHTLVTQTIIGLAQPNNFDAMFDDLWHDFSSAKHWRLFPHALDTLTKLKKSGLQLIILSNWDSRLRQIIDGFNLTPLFDHIFISSEVGYSKPNPRIFSHVQSTLAQEPLDFVHVGDSIVHDVDCAKKSGWQTILINHNQVPGADAAGISCLSHLPKILASKNPSSP